MDNPTKAFLGEDSAWRSAQISLDDVNNLWGGQRITVRGDGHGYLTLVDVGLAERHYWFPLGDERARQILELAVTQDLLSVPDGRHGPVPDETSTRLILSNAAGETHILQRWADDGPDAGFQALRDALMGLKPEARGPEAKQISEIPPLGAADHAPALKAGGEKDSVPDRILRAFIDYFEADDWRFERSDAKPVLRLSFQGRNGHTWSCFAQSRMNETQAQALFYSVAPIKVLEPKRLAISEFITRANYGMIIGNFEMDFSDGELRYKTSVDLAGGTELNHQLIKPLVYTNVLMMDKYLPGVMEILYGEVSPEQAIRKIEG